MGGFQLQAPQRDQTPVLNRNPRKVAKKSLNSAGLISAGLDSLLSAKNSPASEKVAVSDPTSTPTLTLANTKFHEVDSVKMATSVEAELVIKRLEEARIQVLKSKDLGPSKKLVEALIDVTIKEFGGLYEECEWHDKLLSSKSNLAFLICIMVVFALLMVWFFRWISKDSFTGLTPT